MKNPTTALQPYSPTAKQSGKVTYRQDINGMRAWAVIVVLLFHFKIPGISAGFVGVDVFFVISGFLMTAIIVKGLEANSFSIWQFYMARIRRIIPALMVLIAVLLVLGWFWLPTPDYKALGSESAYALGFLSNIHFWRSAGYFDAAAQEKWLLHTWSLGIEFQFYILFPIFVIILWKIKPKIKTLFWGLGFAFIASLALSIMISSLQPAAAFYLLPTRGWELAAGGLAFLIGREVPSLKRFSKPMFWLGFVLWLLAVFVIDDTFAWPSGWALLPVLGTFLIILAPQANSKLMLHPLAQWFGNRSYSLYLWHWPFVVALYFAGLSNDWLWVASALALSLLLGNLSYWYVEKPASTYLTASGFSKQVTILAAASVVIALAAVSVRVFNYDGRLPPEIEAVAAEVNNKNPRVEECFRAATDKSSPGCVYGSSSVGAILAGDSHSSATVTSLSAAGASFKKGVRLFGLSSCPTIKGLKNIDHPQCFGFNNWLLEEKLKEADLENIPLILMSRTSIYVHGYNEDENPIPVAYFDEPLTGFLDEYFIKQFKAALVKTSCDLAEDRSVYLVRPIPEMRVSVPNTLARNMIFGIGNDDVKITLDEYHERHKLVWEAQDQAAEQCGIKILNPLPYLCDDLHCYGSRDGFPLYSDDDHLSEHGNKLLVPMFEQIFTW